MGCSMHVMLKNNGLYIHFKFACCLMGLPSLKGALRLVSV